MAKKSKKRSRSDDAEDEALERFDPDSLDPGDEPHQATKVDSEEGGADGDTYNRDNNNDNVATKSKRKRKRKRKKKEASEENHGGDGKDDDTNIQPQEHIDDNDNNQNDNETTAKTRQVDRTIYVEGLAFSSNADELRAFFASHSLTDLEDVRLPVWQDTGRLRGYGHVVFSSLASKQAALELSGRTLGPRYLTIQEARAPKSVQSSTVVDPHSNPSRTIMLHNLSYQATEDDIQKVMERYGTIVDGGVRVVRHSDTGRSKGFGYVEFEHQDSAVNVMKQQQQPQSQIVICQRPCRVDYDHGRVRGSFRTADRKLWHKEYKHNNHRHSNSGRLHGSSSS